MIYCLFTIGITKLREEDVGYLVEILATYAGKWKEIGIQLGFLPNELDALPFSQKPVGSLTYMLNEWTQWAVGGSHNKYATMEDLERALRKKVVNLGVIADELRGKWTQAKGQLVHLHNVLRHVNYWAPSPLGCAKEITSTGSA